jgi:hypothetical protein
MSKKQENPLVVDDVANLSKILGRVSYKMHHLLRLSEKEVPDLSRFLETAANSSDICDDLARALFWKMRSCGRDEKIAVFKPEYEVKMRVSEILDWIPLTAYKAVPYPSEDGLPGNISYERVADLSDPDNLQRYFFSGWNSGEGSPIELDTWLDDDDSVPVSLKAYFPGTTEVLDHTRGYFGYSYLVRMVRTVRIDDFYDFLRSGDMEHAFETEADVLARSTALISRGFKTPWGDEVILRGYRGEVTEYSVSQQKVLREFETPYIGKGELVVLKEKRIR